MSRDREPSCDRLPGLDSERQAWSQLAEASGNVFSTPEWASTWWRHFGGGRELRLICCRRGDGSPAVLLPLYLHRSSPLRVLRFVGNGPADELGPVCAPGERELAAGALVDVLADQRWRADVLVADRLGAGDELRRLAGARLMVAQPSPLLDTAGRGWDDFLASKSKNFRDQVRRRERKLRRDHGLEFRLSDRERLDADMQSLVRLHDARWAGASSAFAGPLAAFHRDFAALALERGWLRLWVAEIEAEPVAVWHGFSFAGSYSFYQSGRDPARDDLSVGFVLLAHTIRCAFEEGMRQYRFLRGGDAYKDRFADADPGVETVVLGRGPLGRAAIAAAGALARLPRGGRLLARAGS